MQTPGDLEVRDHVGKGARHVSRREAGSAARRFGYSVAIAINLAMIYVFHHLLEWGVPFVTESFADVLWALDLSLGTQVAANALYLTYDQRWLRRLGAVVLDALSFFATYTLWRVFPLDFGSVAWNDLARYALVLVMVVTAIATIVEAAQLLLRGNEA